MGARWKEAHPELDLALQAMTCERAKIQNDHQQELIRARAERQRLQAEGEREVTAKNQLEAALRNSESSARNAYAALEQRLASSQADVQGLSVSTGSEETAKVIGGLQSQVGELTTALAQSQESLRQVYQELEHERSEKGLLVERLKVVEASAKAGVPRREVEILAKEKDENLASARAHFDEEIAKLKTHYLQLLQDGEAHLVATQDRERQIHQRELDATHAK